MPTDRLWLSGPSLNSVASAMEYETTSGTQSISTTVTRVGPYSLRFNPTAGSSFIRQPIFASDQSTTAYLRLWLYIATYPSANVTVIRIADTANNPCGQLQLSTTGTFSLRDAANNGVGSASSALSLATWYRIELMMNGTATTNALSARINGAAAFATGNNSAITPWARVVLGPVATVTTDLHICDVGIGDNTWLGDGIVLTRFPNGTGDNNAWNNTANGAGSTLNYDLMDDRPPDDATTLVRTGTVNAIDDYAMADSGIGFGDLVRCVFVGVRGRTVGADAVTAMVARIKKTSGGTVTESSPIIWNATAWRTNAPTVDRTYPIRLTVDPDGNPWTRDTLDSLQAGLRLSAFGTQQAQASGIWTTFEYLPATPITLTSGIASAEAFGTATIGSSQSIAPSSIASGEAFGTATVAAQAATISVSSIASAEAHGSATLTSWSPLGAIQDDFTTDRLATVWPGTYGTSPNFVTVTGGRARIPCTTDYTGIETAASYSLTSSSIFARVYPAASAGATSEAWTELIVSSSTLGTDATIRYEATTGNVTFNLRTGYFDPSPTTLTYDATNHAWWRIREASGTTYWETSADGSSWTSRRTATTPAWASALNLHAQIGTHRDGGTGNYAEADNVNINTLDAQITVSGIASAEQHGTPALSLGIVPPSITSAEAFGTASIAQAVAPTGISSAEAHGTATLALGLAPASIGTGEAFGTTSIVANAIITPAGIASQEAHGSASVALALAATAITSTETFGTPTITQTIAPAGIASAEQHGAAELGLTVSPTGIGTSEAFGNPTLSGDGTLLPQGITTGEAFGTPTITAAAQITPTGIPSGEAFGTPALASGTIVSPSGIASAEAFGTTSLALTAALAGIASAEAFGTLTVLIGIAPSAIPSAEAFGAPLVASSITPTGIGTGEQFGTAALTATAVLSLTGIASREAFGALAVSGGLQPPQDITVTLGPISQRWAAATLIPGTWSTSSPVHRRWSGGPPTT